MKLLKIFCCLLLALLWTQIGFGQSVTVLSPTLNLDACGAVDSVVLEFNAAPSTDSVVVTLPMIPELTFAGLGGSASNVSVVSQNDTVWLVLDGGTSFPDTITFALEANCDAINDSSNQISGYTVNQSLTADFYTGGASTAVIGDFDAQIHSPNLEFLQLDEPINPLVGSQVAKTIYIANTSQTVLNGSMQLTVSVGNHLDLLALASASPALTNINVTLSTTTAILTAEVVNLLPGDSLVFTDSVLITNCNIDSNKTYYQFVYGCDSTDRCHNLPIPNSSLAPGTVVPSIRRLPLQGESLCFFEGDEIDLSIRVTNIGATAAFDFRVALGTVNGRPKVDPAKMYGILNGDTLPIFQGVMEDSLLAWNVSGTCYDGMIRTSYFVIPQFNPGDTLEFQFSMQKCCAGTLTSLFMPEFNFSSRNLCTGASYSHGYSLTRNSYSQTQFFENYISNIQPGNTVLTPPTTLSSDSIDFAINNVVNSFSFYNVIYQDSLIRGGAGMFELEMVLDSGLRYVDSTLLMREIPGSSIVFDWLPSEVTKQLNAGGDPLGGYGDTIIAKFPIPADFYFFERGINSLYPHVSFFDSLNQYLSNSQVLFQLQGICPAKEPLAGITQTLYFTPDTNCTSSCRMPISEVFDELAIMCPGCITPGYITSGYELNRVNVGRQDDDNNHWPDDPNNLIAATDSLANLKRAVLGDTLAFSLRSDLWNGQSVTLDNLGFDLPNTVVELTMPSVVTLEGDLAVIIGDSNGLVHTFTYPIANVEQVGNVYSINLHLDSLFQAGLMTDPAFIRYEQRDYVEIAGQVVVTSNVASTNQVEVVESNAKVYATGVWSTLATVDAGDAYANDPTSLDSTMKYWCEAWGARFTHVKIITPFLNGLSSLDLGHVYANRNDCQLRFITVRNGNIPIVGNGFTDDFPFEFRTFFSIDSIKLVKPAGFQLRDIVMSLRNPDYNTAVGYYNHSTGPITAYNTPVNGSYLFDPGQHIRDTTDYPDLSNNGVVQNLDYVLAADEDRHLFYNIFNIVPEICSEVVGDTVQLITDVIFDQWPGRAPGFSVKDTFEVLYPEMTLLPFKLSPDTSIVTDTAFNVRTRITNYAADQPQYGNGPSRYYATLLNCFVQVVSPSGNVVVTDVLNTSGNPYPAGALPGLYELGNLSYVSPNNFRDFDIIGRLDCSADSLSNLDSLLVITGWNCSGYPDTLAHACYLDTTVYYFQPTLVGLDATLDVANTVSICDSLHYTLTLDPKGSGKLYNMRAEIVLPGSGNVNYVPNSGLITWPTPSAGIAIEPISGLNWPLDTVGALRTEGYSFFDGPLTLEFDLDPECGFQNDPIRVRVTATTYCGDEIMTEVTGAPQVITGLPLVTDTLAIVQIDTQFTGCGDSSRISVIYQNTGSVALGDSSRLQMNIPGSLLVSLLDSVHTISGTQYTYLAEGGLTPGTMDTLEVFVIAPVENQCVLDSITVTALAHVNYSCNGINCDSYEMRDFATLQSPNLPDFLSTCSGFHTFDFQGQNLADSCGANWNNWQWQWNFGDPAAGSANSDTTIAPIHVYPGPGLYTVQLVATNPCGRSDSIQQIINVTDCVLPAEGLTFTGEYVVDHTWLNWEVEREEGVAAYYVDRSLDGVSFASLGHVDAAGSSTYEWLDRDLPADATIAFYRLRVLDYDGNSVEGGRVEVLLPAANGNVKVFPNPLGAGEAGWVSFTMAEAGRVDLELTDVLGRTVWRTERLLGAGAQQVEVDWNEVEAGVFFLKVRGPGVGAVIKWRVE